MNSNIGFSIKKLRKNKKMTLKDVSEKTNLSISFLSQVERSICSVTLESLRKISEALEVSPTYFFPDQKKDAQYPVRRNMNSPIEHTASFIYSDLSGEVINPVFIPMIVTLFPGDKRETPFSHKGQEFIYVVEGTLTLLLNEQEYDLSEGDSIHIDSKTPHNWFNKTDKRTRFIFISTSPI